MERYHISRVWEVGERIYAKWNPKQIYKIIEITKEYAGHTSIIVQDEKTKAISSITNDRNMRKLIKAEEKETQQTLR